MWVWSGFVLSLSLAALAWWRSRARVQTFYEGEVYGVTAAGHRKYAIGFTLAAAMFLLGLVWPGFFRGLSPLRAAWWSEALLAAVVLTSILYGATFLRGATGEDE